MATLIAVTGEESEVQPADLAGGFTLAELYRLLDCSTVEVVLALADGRTMVLDEDRKAKRLPENRRATQLGRQAGISPFDFVGGPVLIVNDKELQ